MSDLTKTIKISIFYWAVDVGHIAIKIDDKYTSFNPDRKKPFPMDKRYTRTDVPKFENRSVVVEKFEGKLITSYDKDIELIGKSASQIWHFSIPFKNIDDSILNKPVRSTYQLVDKIKGDDSHNNCVDYVRQELFLYINSDEIKRKLLLIHSPIDFFNAIKAYGIMQDMGATNKYGEKPKV